MLNATTALNIRKVYNTGFSSGPGVSGSSVPVFSVTFSAGRLMQGPDSKLAPSPDYDNPDQNVTKSQLVSPAPISFKWLTLAQPPLQKQHLFL